MQGGTADIFMKKLCDMIDFLLPNYVEEGKNQLVIASAAPAESTAPLPSQGALKKAFFATGRYGLSWSTGHETVMEGRST